MKKSEEIKKEIERLESKFAEDEAEVLSHLEEEGHVENENRFHDFWESRGKAIREKITQLDREYRKEVNRELQVGDGVTLHLWTDREAYTVIARTKCTLTIQRDKATRDPSFKPEWVTGGFSAICLNDHEQKWILERDPNGRIEVCHWSEKKGRWQTGEGQIGVYAGRYEYYDYNF